MDDAGFVRDFEGVGDLDGVLDGARHRQRTPHERLRERLAAHVLHHDEIEAVGGVDLVNRDDVRVNERGGRTGLADEPFVLPGLLTAANRQDLDGDLALEARIDGAPHFSHAAGAKALGDFVVQQLATDHVWLHRRHPDSRRKLSEVGSHSTDGLDAEHRCGRFASDGSPSPNAVSQADRGRASSNRTWAAARPRRRSIGSRKTRAVSRATNHQAARRESGHAVHHDRTRTTTGSVGQFEQQPE